MKELPKIDNIFTQIISGLNQPNIPTEKGKPGESRGRKAKGAKPFRGLRRYGTPASCRKGDV